MPSRPVVAVMLAFTIFTDAPAISAPQHTFTLPVILIVCTAQSVAPRQIVVTVMNETTDNLLKVIVCCNFFVNRSWNFTQFDAESFNFLM